MPAIRAIHEQMIEIATLGDAAWFAANPDRRIRIRKAVTMEFDRNLGGAPDGMEWHALVLEAQPGARVRQPVALLAGTPLAEMGDEDLYAIFMRAASPEAREMLKTLRSTKLAGAPISVAPKSI